MADEGQVAILRTGVKSWNEWRRLTPGLHVDLSGAELSNADLASADLKGVNLKGANLRCVDLLDAHLYGADLRGCTLIDANLMDASMVGALLRGANLQSARLFGANLERTDLSGAYMTDADLRHALAHRANFSHAKLFRVNFAEASFGDTIFANVNLGSAIGIDRSIHRGPSTLDHRTLSLSGRLPIVFLRGCGLPDRLIEYLPSLLGANPIDFYSCFISYSTQDEEFARRLHADLQANDVRCWYAPHDIQGGRKIHEQIDEAISVSEKLLLILSAASMNSEWVKTEIAYARQKETTEKRKVLFPIALVPYDEIKAWKNFDADTGKDSAREVREFYIPNFRGWKDPDSYRVEFGKLLRDLRNT